MVILRRLRRPTAPRPADLCPDDGCTDSLVSNVSRFMNRDVEVVVAPLPVGLSGVWTSTDEREVVMLAEGSSDLRRRVALCHEVAHMVLGHGAANDADAAEIDLDLLAQAMPDLDPRLIKQALFRTGCELGDPEQEMDAESYGTALFTRLESARRAQGNRQSNRFS